MAYSVSLPTLLTTVRTMCAIENNQVCTDAELTTYINLSGAWLNDILVQSSGNYNLKKSSDFVLTPGTDTYLITASPISVSDFMQCRGVDVKVNGSQYIPINEFKLGERQYYQNQASNMSAYGPLIAYLIQGGSIVFAPVPQTAYTIRLRYNACWTDLAGSATADFIDGWHRLLLNDVCRMVTIKQDLPVVGFERAMQVDLDRIEKIKEQRDASAPPRITDVAGDLNDRFTTWGRFGA